MLIFIHEYAYTCVQGSLAAAEKVQDSLKRQIKEQSEALKKANDELVEVREQYK
jgi:hypothetical protein